MTTLTTIPRLGVPTAEMRRGMCRTVVDADAKGDRCCGAATVDGAKYCEECIGVRYGDADRTRPKVGAPLLSSEHVGIPTPSDLPAIEGTSAEGDQAANLPNENGEGDLPNSGCHVLRADVPGNVPRADVTSDQLRPVAPICIAELPVGHAATGEPIFDRMAPETLLIDAAYQRDLSPKGYALIKQMISHWDWRRFRPPVVAMTDRGFEIIDGQHTAIAATSHPDIAEIPVMIVEAAVQQDRAQAFIGHNKDRLAVTPMQLHHAAVAAGDEDAVTIAQVCQRAGVRLVTSAYGSYAWKPGETMAIGALQGMISRRGALKSRQMLEVLVAAGRAPIAASDIKAVETLFCDPNYSAELEPLPAGGEDLAAAIKALGAGEDAAVREVMAAQCFSRPKATAIVWFRKCRKRRKPA